MRSIVALSALLLAATAFGPAQARSSAQSWCSLGEITTCGYVSLRQCLEAVAGNGGFCEPEAPQPLARRHARS